MTNDLLNEQLSALVDGELPPEETALLLKRLEREPELRAHLARYSLAGDVLRGERLKARPQFAMRVAHALAGEPAHAMAAGDAAVATSGGAFAAGSVVPARRNPAAAAQWLRPLAGLAVAATVAGVAVFVVKRGADEPNGTPVVTIAARDVAREVARGGDATPPPTVARSGNPLAAAAGSREPASYVTPAQRRQVGAIPPGELANYVVAHVEFITPIGRGSVITGLVADGAPVEAAAR